VHRDELVRLDTVPAELEEEIPQKSPFRDVPLTCSCPTAVRNTVESIGTTCQDIFRRAMHVDGYPEAFSRAIFVLYCLAGSSPELVPRVVMDYCAQVRIGPKVLGRSMDKCMGCWLDRPELERLKSAYTMILPDVDSETLTALSKSRLKSALPVEIERSELEQAWADIKSSGILENLDDTFDSLIHDEGSLG